MPFYQYKCDKTQEDVTRMVKMADKDTQVCKCTGKLKPQLTTSFVANANSGGRK